jgi:hypothetical protein
METSVRPRGCSCGDTVRGRSLCSRPASSRALTDRVACAGGQHRDGSTATESRYLQSEDPEWPVSLRAVNLVVREKHRFMSPRILKEMCRDGHFGRDQIFLLE